MFGIFYTFQENKCVVSLGNGSICHGSCWDGANQQLSSLHFELCDIYIYKMQKNLSSLVLLDSKACKCIAKGRVIETTPHHMVFMKVKSTILIRDWELQLYVEFIRCLY